MKTYDQLSGLCKDLATLKQDLRQFNEYGLSFLRNVDRVGSDPQMRAVKIGHNDLASVRFKAMQALTLVEQAHAILAECDLEIVDVASKKKVMLSVEETDLTL